MVAVIIEWGRAGVNFSWMNRAVPHPKYAGSLALVSLTAWENYAMMFGLAAERKEGSEARLIAHNRLGLGWSAAFHRNHLS